MVPKMTGKWEKWMAANLYLFIITSYHQQTTVSCEVTYDELNDLKASCGDLDSCQGNRTTDDLRVVNCQCGPICTQLGTCCIDAKHRTPGVDKANKRIAATKVYRSRTVVFMVNDCKPGWAGEREVKALCESSVPLDTYFKDPFLRIPVTNLKSGITYRNYFCFACNEDKSSDSPVLWEIHLFSDGDNHTLLGNISEMRFDERFRDYTANDSQNVYFFSTIGIPEKLYPHLNWYRQGVIGSCAEKWTDLKIKEKCQAYTALVYFYEQYRSAIYKNPHCAICNNKSVSGLRCTEPKGNEVGGGGPPNGFLLSGTFSFEDKVSRCQRNEVFDKFLKKCRAFKCGQNQKMVKGKCERNSAPKRSSRRPAKSPASNRNPSSSQGRGVVGSVVSTRRNRPRQQKRL